MDSKWMWIIAAAAGAYVLYEWLSSQCETVGGSFYGGSLCESLFPSAAATTQIPTQVTPSTATAAQAQVLAAYGLPADAVPSAMYPSGDDCTVVNPTQSGYNPVPGAPFYSPSLGQYICGPASIWEQMQGAAVVASAVPVPAALPPAPTQTVIPTSAQANAGPTLLPPPINPLMNATPIIVGGPIQGISGVRR
jgi:hypothetical protein